MDVFKLKRYTGRKSRKSSQTIVDPYESLTATEMGQFPAGQKLAPIHICAMQGKIALIEKAVKSNPQLLELRTTDGNDHTLLHLSLIHNKLNTFKSLISLGASLEAVDVKGQNVIEMALDLGKINILVYLSVQDFDKLAIWIMLEKRLRSDFENELTVAVNWLRDMLNYGEEKDDKVLENIPESVEQSEVENDANDSQNVVQNEQTLLRLKAIDKKIIKSILTTMKKTEPAISKTHSYWLFKTLYTLLLTNRPAKEQSINCGIMPVIVKILSNSQNLPSLAEVIEKIKAEEANLEKIEFLKWRNTSAKKEDDHMTSLKKDVELIGVSCEIRNYPKDVLNTTLKNVVACVGTASDQKLQLLEHFAETSNSYTTLIQLIKDDNEDNNEMTCCACESIVKLTANHMRNQLGFAIGGELLTKLTKLIRSTNTDLQEHCIDTLQSLLTGNHTTQQLYFQMNLTSDLFKNSTALCGPTLKDKFSVVLWTVADSAVEVSRRVAEMVGGGEFVEYFYSQSMVRHRIAAEGVRCLASLPCCPVLTTDDKAKVLAVLIEHIADQACDASLLLTSMETVDRLVVLVAHVVDARLQKLALDTSVLEHLVSIVLDRSGRKFCLRLQAALTFSYLITGKKNGINLIKPKKLDGLLIFITRILTKDTGKDDDVDKDGRADDYDDKNDDDNNGDDVTKVKNKLKASQFFVNLCYGSKKWSSYLKTWMARPHRNYRCNKSDDNNNYNRNNNNNNDNNNYDNNNINDDADNDDKDDDGDEKEEEEIDRVNLNSDGNLIRDAMGGIAGRHFSHWIKELYGPATTNANPDIDTVNRRFQLRKERDVNTATILNCIACLSRYDSGVPESLIAVAAVEHICPYVHSETELIKGFAVVALRYLSNNLQGCTQILKRRHEIKSK
ncbi:hypothetical protein HELRODRAFT_163175 [Helobdella robusta]|uniref:Uncharacterized protein n=1 Tax=Helobdella robusta TaxID=6412 RepID=T1ETR3_HELRO|nr:hypothetical protein HELRODRAFT_163175 [Helobdella robusta]ESN96143.1 hypothetical protein HELRODRAFT_163175 [Helobdella robusta]